MIVTPELTALAVISAAMALMWVPYVLGRMLTSSVAAALGNPGPGYLTGAPWADRARRAHLNAIENLAVFAPLVLVGAIAGVSSPATALAAGLSEDSPCQDTDRTASSSSARWCRSS